MYTQENFPFKEITERIIACALEVHSTLYYERANS
jgi:hypothetical protein